MTVMTRRLFIVALSLFAGLWTVSAQLTPETPSLVTFGPDAPSVEGDPDHLQVLYLQVPESATSELYLRIFDADTFGDHDQVSPTGETQVRFSLFGGEGAYTAPTARTPSPVAADLVAGVRLATQTVGASADLNDTWHTMASFAPSQGELVDGYYTFKLVVEGVAGRGGNAFTVAVSERGNREVAPSGLRLFSYAPTVRVPTADVITEMRFVPVDTDVVMVHNFDAASADVTVETAFRSLSVTASGQDEWRESPVTLAGNELGQPAAVTFGGGTETPNDGTFYLIDRAGQTMPIGIPIFTWRPNARPVPVPVVELLADCSSVGFDATGSTDADGNGLSFRWHFGDGRQSPEAAVVHRYDQPGTYQAVLEVIDDSGQTAHGALARMPVTVNAAPIAQAGDDRLAAPGQLLSFDGTGSRDVDGAIAQYLWDFGDGSTGEGVAPTHAFERPGTYRVTLTVRDGAAAPCDFGLDRLDVRVNAAPVAVPGESRTLAIGESTVLDGSRSFDTDGQILSYTWDLGDGTTATTPTVEHAYRQPGRYDVSLSVRDDADAINSVATERTTIVVNGPPVAEAGTDRRAAIAEVVEFDASGSVDPDGRITEYQWDFGDGHVGAGPRVAYAFTEAGRYQVKLNVRDDSASSTDSAETSVVIVVNAPPKAVAGEDRVISASEVQFDASQSADADGQIARYLWEFGDGSTSAEANPVHAYRTPGTYPVNLTVTDDSGTVRSADRDSLTVVVNAPPVADAGPDQAGAPSQSLTFASTQSFDTDGDIDQFMWDFGDGATGTGRVVAHAFDRPGTYTVKLAVTDNTGHPRAIDYDESTVTINAPPVANAGPDVLAAPGQPVTLSGRQSFDLDGQVSSYRWTFSDGQGEASTADATRTFEFPGVYTAQLSIVDNSNTSNGTAQDTTTIRINQRPLAVPGSDVTTGNGTVAFDGAASADPDGDPLTYMWDFGDGTPPATGTRVTHTYPAGGSYPIVLTVDDGTGLANSSNSSSMTVTINRVPLANAGGDRIVCAGNPVLFDGTASADPDGGLLRYRWDFGDGTSAIGVNPTKTYNVGGVYPVILTVEDDSGLSGNAGASQIIVRVAESPIADAGPDIRACANSPVQFDGTASRDFDGVVNQFTWDFGDGSTGGGATPAHAYVQPGTYRVFLTIEGDPIGECDYIHTDEKLVTVAQSPVARFVAPETAALNLPVTFDASSSLGAEGLGLVSWQWDFGDGTMGEGLTASHAYAIPGRYVVTLTVGTGEASLDCATVSTRRVIIVNNAPLANAGDPQLVGVNQEVVLDARRTVDEDGAIASYDWNFGDGSTGSGVEVRHRFAQPGRYNVVLTARDDAGLANSVASDTVEITVNDAPRPVITRPIGVCVNEDAVLSGAQSVDSDGQVASYAWFFGDGAQADGPEVSHAYAAPGRYSVTLAVDDGTRVSNSRAELTETFLVNLPPMPEAGPARRVCPGEPVPFDASASSDIDGTLMAFNWDFGDGATAVGSTASHRYAAAGTFLATLAVTDDSGTACGRVEDTADIIVNATPVAQAGEDRQAFLGAAYDAVVFDATGSSDADGDPLTYAWDFGDGTSDTGPSVSHAYASPGRYVVRLTVRDGTGLACGQAQDEVVVDVRERR